MSLSQELRDEGGNPVRMRSLSDGVFAIVLTFLIFRLDISKLTEATNDTELIELLKNQASPFLGYVLSFFIIGGFWLLHQTIFKSIQRTNRELLWLNLNFLFWVSILPLSTSINASAVYVKTAWYLYALNVAIAGLSVLAIWLRACKQGLIHRSVSTVVREYMIWRIAVIPVVFLLSLPVAKHNGQDAHWTPILLPILSWVVHFVFSRRNDVETEVLTLFSEPKEA